MRKINTPELSTAEGQRAKVALEALLLGRRVCLDVDDLYKTDRYGRFIAVAYLDYNETHWLNVNQWLVERGYVAYVDYPNELHPPWPLYLPKAATPKTTASTTPATVTVTQTATVIVTVTRTATSTTTVTTAETVTERVTVTHTVTKRETATYTVTTTLVRESGRPYVLVALLVGLLAAIVLIRLAMR